MSDSALPCPQCGRRVPAADDECQWCGAALVPHDRCELPPAVPPPTPAMPAPPSPPISPPPAPLSARRADAVAEGRGNWWDRQMLAGPEFAYWLFALVLGLLAIVFFALCHFLATKEAAKKRAGRVLIFGAALLALGPLVGLIGRLVLYLSQLGTSPVP